LNEKVSEKLIELLRAVYNRANWSKITGRGRISKFDVFAHRVKAAAYQDTVPKFLDKLCHGLSLQSVDVDPGIITVLDLHRDEVLSALRQETIYWILLSARR